MIFKILINFNQFHAQFLIQNLKVNQNLKKKNFISTTLEPRYNETLRF